MSFSLGGVAIVWSLSPQIGVQASKYEQSVKIGGMVQFDMLNNARMGVCLKNAPFAQMQHICSIFGQFCSIL